MVIWKKDCPILKGLNEALERISEYPITYEEKERCMKHFLFLKCCCGDHCRYSPLSRLVAVRLRKTCSIINMLPYVRYDPKDNCRIFGIYYEDSKVIIRVG